MMDPDLKAKWVAALRSGKYKQGQRVLRKGDKYCCLGVLCDVGGAEWEGDGKFYCAKLGDCESYASLPGEDGSLAFGMPEQAQAQLWRMNDGTGGKRAHTFNEIADYIESDPNI